MNNFFTNLATRTFSPAENVLLPKLPSLFESPGSSEPVMEESMSTEGHEPPLESTQSAPAPYPARHVNEQRETFSRTEANREPDAQRQTLLPFTPQEQPPMPVQIQSERQTIIAPMLTTEAAPRERQQSVIPRVEAVTQPAREQDGSKSMQEIAPRLVLAPSLPRPEASHPGSRPEDNARSNMLSLEEKSTTVRIHIGRIEVRAVTSSAPPARATAPSRPRLTLDEYLLRRNEGKR